MFNLKMNSLVICLFGLVAITAGLNVKLSTKEKEVKSRDQLLLDLEEKLQQFSQKTHLSRALAHESRETVTTPTPAKDVKPGVSLLELTKGQQGGDGDGDGDEDGAGSKKRRQYYGGSSCGGTLSEPSGTISSPQYAYGRFSLCDWYINAPENSRIELTITGISLQCNSYQMTEGVLTTVSPSQPICGSGVCGSTICGTSNPSQITLTSSSQMWVRYFSFTGWGYFSASYNVVPMATPPPPPPPADPPQMTMTSNTGVITTEGYPNTNYANNLEQLWEISSSESDKVIQLNFDAFDVEDPVVDGPDCIVYDALIIDDGTPIDATRVYPNCDPIPESLVLNSNHAELRFQTDGSETGRGFSISYTMVDPPPTEEPTTDAPLTGQAEVGINDMSCGAIGGANRMRRIMGGNHADAHEYPWQTLIRAFVTRNSYQHCGGSLLTNNWVVTAAHCLEKDNGGFVSPADVQLHFGQHDMGVRESSEQIMTASQLFIHPQRNDRSPGSSYDIALVKTSQTVILGPHVNTICLDDGRVSAGQQCYVSGWGKTHRDSRTVDVLREVELDVLTNFECGNQWDSRIPSDMICAKKSRSLASSCQGDSGGPLACPVNSQFYLTGVVSWGNPCGQSSSTDAPPSVFARASYYAQWIIDTIKANE